MEAILLLLDGNSPAILEKEFSVVDRPNMICGENLTGDITLEVKTDTGFIPVVEEGEAVVLSNSATNPLGIYVNGEYRLVATSLGSTEKIYLQA